METDSHLSNTNAPDFGAVFDAMTSPYLVLDRAFHIVAANQAYLSATKTVRGEIVGRDVFEVFPANPQDPGPSGQTTLRASLAQVVRTGAADMMAIHKYDIQLSGPGGVCFEERYWSCQNTPVLDDAGAVDYIIHQVEDVTEFVRSSGVSEDMATRIDNQAMEIESVNRRLRESNATLERRVLARTRAQKLMEEKLRASELRFRMMADAIPQIVWIIDDSGRGVYFNRQWAAYTGVALESMAPSDLIGEFIHPDDRAITAEAWSHASETGTNYVVEHRIRAANGEYRWFLVRADLHIDEATGEGLWFGTSTDVNDRKLAEADISAREEMLRLAIDAADVGEWDVDMLTEAMFWPPRVKAMFGISPDRPVVLADYYDGVHPDDRAHTLASFARAADPALRVQYDAEYRTIGKEDGVLRWVAAKGRGLFNEAGQCIRMIGTAIDITQRKAIEEALREREERLRQADRKKDEFLAMLAHELRNPLAPISAAAELLQMGQLTEQRVHQTSQIIGRQVRHMTGLVDDLLDVSRVTRGLVTLSTEPLDINQIITEAIEQASPILRARHHKLALEMSSEATFVMGDRKRLVQVLTNLLNNAGKYTNEGGHITVHSEVQRERVMVRVSDDGIGMSPELISCAFDLFAQAERSSDRSSGGLGLGLALVRSIVDLHGGTVECSSAGAGQGSTFTVCLPRLDDDSAQGAAQGRAGEEPPDSLNIMLVDDNVDAASMLGMLLEASGHRVTIEQDALRALATSRQLRPDVFLLDIGLPEIDGNELARRLRAQPETADAVIVAVTGYGQEQDRRLALEAGFDHHLLKPVDFSKMAALLAGVRPAR